MGKLITVIGPSGVGKTALVQALAKRHPFATALEQHDERPFQALFKQDARYGLANQIDYFLLRAEQERTLRASPKIGLIDGGLDLDYHGFTRLFHARGLLTDPECALCGRLYETLRAWMPLPDLIIRLRADRETVAGRLSARDRINIALAEDVATFESFLDEWLASVPAEQVLEIDVSNETMDYNRSVERILKHIHTLGDFAMTLDRSFIDLNRASQERMRDLAKSLTDEELLTKVGEHWTVGIVYAHIAWWDRRVMYVLDMTEKDGKLFIPEIDIFVNDLSLPLWAAVPPREAVRIALETAETLDKRLEEYSPALLEEIFNYNKRWVVRALHRNEHLDEAVGALKSSGKI